ncbi:MAG: ECF transporter S component [Eubacterium sp.]|nr:ECF transporter S component [Eubacterium sp.]
MKRLLAILLALISLTAVLIWMMTSATKSYLLISLIILVLSMLPFFITFEKSRPSARELALISGITAIAVVSRAVFYLLPQVKPIAAVVIIGAVCMGAKAGYMIGAFSAFISNFIFGQGAHTPFQMVALGLVGFISGLIFSKVKPDKITLSATGFLLTFIVYGIIADTSTVMFMVTDFNIPAIVSVYAAGVPFSFVFALTTAVCLYVFGEQFIIKLERINTKFGLYMEDSYAK